MQIRACKECKAEKPHTIEFFPVSQGRLRGSCRECRLAYAKRYREQNAEKVRASQKRSVEARREYYRAKAKEYCEAYKPQSKARLAKLYRENADTFKERAKAWKAANPDRKRELDAAWRRANRDRMAKNVAAWKAANPERWAQISRGICARRRAREKEAPGSFTAADVEAQLSVQKRCCWWCSLPLEKYHADHLIPLSRGGSNGPENIVISCPTCNMKKGSKMPWEFQPGRML